MLPKSYDYCFQNLSKNQQPGPRGSHHIWVPHFKLSIGEGLKVSSSRAHCWWNRPATQSLLSSLVGWILRSMKEDCHYSDPEVKTLPISTSPTLFTTPVYSGPRVLDQKYESSKLICTPWDSSRGASNRAYHYLHMVDSTSPSQQLRNNLSYCKKSSGNTLSLIFTRIDFLSKSFVLIHISGSKWFEFQVHRGLI